MNSIHCRVKESKSDSTESRVDSDSDFPFDDLDTEDHVSTDASN